MVRLPGISYYSIALSVCRHARIIHATGHARIVSPSHSTCASTLSVPMHRYMDRYGPSLYNLLYTYSLYSYILVPGIRYEYEYHTALYIHVQLYCNTSTVSSRELFAANAMN